MVVASGVFTCTQPVLALTLVTVPSIVRRPVIWSVADCAEATPTLATSIAPAIAIARMLFIWILRNLSFDRYTTCRAAGGR